MQLQNVPVDTFSSTKYVIKYEFYKVIEINKKIGGNIMKTKELIKFVNQHEGLYVKEQGELLTFYEEGMDRPYFILSKLANYWSDGSSNLEHIKKVNLGVLLDVGDHIIGYLNTPPEEREDVKLYHLISTVPFLKESEKYYKVNFNEKRAYFGTKKTIGPYQATFTNLEIAKLAEFGIKGLERLEVKNNE